MNCKLCECEIKNNINNRKICNSCNVALRRYRLKMMAVAHLGSECSVCGYNKNISALQFHHKSTDKSYNISGAYHKSWDEIKTELSKCIILCANCHAEHHFNKSKEFLKEATVYFDKPLTLELFESYFEPGITNCLVCNKKLNRSISGLCKEHADIAKRKVTRPPVEEIQRIVDATNFSAAGRYFGVSDNAVRNWLKIK